MARKVNRAPAPSATEQPSAAEDVSALHPDATLTLAGRKVTIREYGFFDGMEVAHQARAFIADMREQCRDGQLRFASVRRLFGVHRDVVVAIAARSADVEPEWVLALAARDAQAFMETWFAVNSGFFVREVVVELQEELRLLAMRPIGSGSSSGSPTPASGTSTASGVSPSAS